MNLKQLRAAANTLGLELSDEDLQAIDARIAEVKLVLARNSDDSDWGPESPYRFDPTDQTGRAGVE